MAIIARILAFARGAAPCLALCLPLGACVTLDPSAEAPRIQSAAALPADESALRQLSEKLGRRYDSNPAERENVIAYAAVLRKLQRYPQAAAVLQREAARMPDDLDVLAAYGKALADAGRLNEAADVLSHAHTPERPNWSVLSAQGAVADQLGDHKAAQDFYEAALKMAPDEPNVLSNLGLSYALTQDLARAETMLRRAVDLPGADARVRQNYALVLSLRGKFRAATSTTQRDLSDEAALQNVTAIRQSLVQTDTWAQLAADRPRKPPARTAVLTLRPTH